MRIRLANTRTQRLPGTADLPALHHRSLGRTPKLAVRAIALVLSAILLASAPLDAVTQSSRQKKKKVGKHKIVPCRAGCVSDTSAPDVATVSAEDATAYRELSKLTRDLHNATPGAYDKLVKFAGKNADTVWGARAALALGYDDYSKNHAPQALAWLNRAVGAPSANANSESSGDPLLREYALYWRAQTERQLKRHAEAYADLTTILQDFPTSAQKEQVLDALSDAALDLGKSNELIEALNAYAGTAAKPLLLLDRARAYQAASIWVRATKDYQTLYYKHPLSDEAKAAGSALPQLTKRLGGEFPYATAEMQEQRAQAFFDAHKWREARPEFEKLASMLRDPANPVRQLAQLRVAQCRVQLKTSPSLIASLNTPDPEVDAERLWALSQAQRNLKNESAMMAAIDAVMAKYPTSRWAEESLMAAGNYFWVQLDRQRAAAYYQQLLDKFPNGKNAYNAEWRVAWVSYLDRKPEASDRLRVFLLKYPVSANAPDALYWLGRDAERSGNPAHARAYFRKDTERFPQTYFGRAAEARLAKLGSGEEDPVESLEKIPPPPPLRPFDEPVPEKAADRWARAQALRSIAFDVSAEQELKNAYFATSSPRFLLEAAQAAFDQGHFAAGMAYARIIVPSFDSRHISDVPLNVWKALYPLPYEAALRREAARNDIDPMLAAGLIRQESTFQADAVSHAHAIGLMQLLPKTARLLAKQLRVKYTKDKLFEPDYNVQLGSYYFKGLVQLTGAPEYALAAYNAGEDRIAAWKSERAFEEIPEVVESIPFTETREYVQIVSRNADVYRAIYGPNPQSHANAAAQVPAESSRYK